MQQHGLAEQDLDRSPAEDRRGDLRHVASATASCRLLSDSDALAWKGRIRDISTLGIGLLLPERIPAGQLLDIDLENSSGNWSGALRARVIHAEAAGGGFWLIGCAFVSELDDAELRFFHAEKIKPDVDDGRRWVRFPCDIETVCYTCETVPGERLRAQILNVSAGGLGLMVPCEFPQGTIFSLELPSALSQPSRLLLLRVIHCVEQGNRGWFLGCEFAHQLGEEDLRSLLAK